MSMFCFQCEQTAGGKGCTKIGVCGKQPKVANILVSKFDLHPITTPENDLQAILK